MAATTTYTCDHCKETAVNDDNFLTQVRVQLEKRRYGNNRFDNATNLPEASWCKKCLVKFGLVHLGSTCLPAEAAPVEEPTIEDTIRAIVRQELADAGVAS